MGRVGGGCGSRPSSCGGGGRSGRGLLTGDLSASRGGSVGASALAVMRLDLVWSTMEDVRRGSRLDGVMADERVGRFEGFDSGEVAALGSLSLAVREKMRDVKGFCECASASVRRCGEKRTRGGGPGGEAGRVKGCQGGNKAQPEAVRWWRCRHTSVSDVVDATASPEPDGKPRARHILTESLSW